ncbi:hypothetical protein BDU57DRAFT_598114 [Ampelomyces quisqualis]|uniref:Uncharacterized protein n=1 Tax=Ampelomyces quisqualis TaxID=50730 RepID=A0A6A5QAZ5_AMPQU|nr:hypothetical protein BDU57DRAFT_598114 [Ampelomyces quisqualis]
MSTTSTTKRARVVQLYCPEYDVTTSNFMITPSMEYNDVLVHVRASFRGHNLDDIRLCDINGEPLYDNDDSPSCFSAVVSGERILIAVGDERIRPEPELKVEMFLEDDSLPKPLRKLSREDRRNHLRSLRRADALPRLNILRLTLPHSDVISALTELDKANDYKMSRTYSTHASHRIITSNWHVKKMFNADLKCLATIAILSGATCGQSLVIEDMLIDAMLARRQRDGVTDGVSAEDAREVMLDLYSRAGGVGSVWPETKVNHTMGQRKEKKGAYEKAKKKEAKAGLEDTEDADVVARRSGQEVDKLAGRLGKARVPDDRVLESDDEDEDEVKPPGRKRWA